jgi:antitoxin PrlF
VSALTATLTSKGQITVPAAVRRRLGLRRGDTLAFVFDADGTVRLEVPRYATLESLAGAAGSLAQPLAWDDVRAIAREDRAGSDSSE